MPSTNKSLLLLGAGAAASAYWLWKSAQETASKHRAAPPVGKDTPDNRPRVVIVGGGFGGLTAAKSLADAPVRITLIDKNNYHLFQPMLYQVATGELPADDIASPLRAILAKQQNADVLMAEVTGVDTEKRLVQMADRTLPYDILILATGSRYNYFGHPEWQQVAPSLKTVEDAITIRAKVLQSFESAEQEKDPERIKELMTIVLIGGGTTGIELAGSISELIHKTLQTEFRNIDPSKTRIIIIEASDRMMTGFPDDIADQTTEQLKKLGVEIRLNMKVEAIDDKGVTANGERIPSHTVLWTAGTMGTDSGKWIGAETDKKGLVKVNPDLTVPGHPELFVVGDVSTITAPARDIFLLPKAEPMHVPGVAQPAIQQGEYAAKVISHRMLGLAPPPPFNYWDKGNLAQVSRGFAAADLGVAKFTGPFAWLIWLGIHIVYLIGFGNRLAVLIQWGITALTFQRGGRLFPQALAADVPQPSMERSGAEAAV